MGPAEQSRKLHPEGKACPRTQWLKCRLRLEVAVSGVLSLPPPFPSRLGEILVLAEFLSALLFLPTNSKNRYQQRCYGAFSGEEQSIHFVPSAFPMVCSALSPGGPGSRCWLRGEARPCCWGSSVPAGQIAPRRSLWTVLSVNFAPSDGTSSSEVLTGNGYTEPEVTWSEWGPWFSLPVFYVFFIPEIVTQVFWWENCNRIDTHDCNFVRKMKVSLVFNFPVGWIIHRCLWIVSIVII